VTCNDECFIFGVLIDTLSGQNSETDGVARLENIEELKSIS
jgi:hypothetical protein